MNDEASNQGILVDLAGTALTTSLIMAAGVVTGLVAARTLGPAGRGELTAMTIWPSTLLYAGALGMSESTAYFAARHRDQADAVFVTGQSIALVLGILVTIVGWFVLPSILGRQGPAVIRSARVYLLFFSLPCISSLCACAWLQGSGHLRAFNLARAAVHLTTAGVIVVLAIGGRTSVRNFAIAMLIGNASTWAVALYAWYRRHGPTPAWRLALVTPMLSYGARVQVGSWSAAANLRLDQLVLSGLASSAPLGLYVVALSYSSLVATLPGIAGTVMLPRLVRDCASGLGNKTLTTWYRWVLWGTAAVGGCLWLCAGVILPLLFGNGFKDSVALEALLIPSSGVVGMNQFLSVGFRGHGRPGVASRAEMLGLLITIPLLAALLPTYGIYGAAFTSLCAYTVSGAYLLFKVGGIVASRRELWLPCTEDWLMVKRSANRLASSAGLV